MLVDILVHFLYRKLCMQNWSGESEGAGTKNKGLIELSVKLYFLSVRPFAGPFSVLGLS